MSPRVSVIIPNYNHALFLEQRIDSVLGQTYDNVEIIILDDFSTDDSEQVIEKYRNTKKVSNIIYNEVNSGSVFKQWQRGIELATGDYIWIAESDDFADFQFLEKALNNFTDNVGVVFTNTLKVDIDGEIISNVAERRKPIFDELSQYNNLITKYNFPKFLVENLIIENASSVLFSRKVFENIDFKTLISFKNTGDRFLYIGSVLNVDILFLRMDLNFMRQHSNNTTQQNIKSGNIYKDRLACINYYMDAYSANKLFTVSLFSFLRKFFTYFIDFCSYRSLQLLLDNLRKKKILTNKWFFILTMYNLIFNKLFQKQVGRFRNNLEKMMSNHVNYLRQVKI